MLWVTRRCSYGQRGPNICYMALQWSGESAFFKNKLEIARKLLKNNQN